MDIDTLWQLKGAFDVTPQWSSYWVPGLSVGADDEDAGPGNLLTNREKKNNTLALMDTGYESGDSMPALQSISNSSENDSDSEEESEEEDEDDWASEDEGYDEEQEDRIRELLREAMDAAHEVDWFEGADAAKTNELDPLKADTKRGNPFMNLLGSLRGMSSQQNSCITWCNRRFLRTVREHQHQAQGRNPARWASPWWLQGHTQRCTKGGSQGWSPQTDQRYVRCDRS